MSTKELRRVEVFGRVASRSLRLEDAQELLPPGGRLYTMKPWVRQTWTMPRRSPAPIFCFMR